MKRLQIFFRIAVVFAPVLGIVALVANNKFTGEAHYEYNDYRTKRNPLTQEDYKAYVRTNYRKIEEATLVQRLFVEISVFRHDLVAMFEGHRPVGAKKPPSETISNVIAFLGGGALSFCIFYSYKYITLGLESEVNSVKGLWKRVPVFVQRILIMSLLCLLLIATLRWIGWF